MRVSNKYRGIIGLSIIAILYVTAISYVMAASLVQATDNIGDGTNQSWNRGFVCSPTTEFCYAVGGGTSSANDVDSTFRYDPAGDTWSDAAMADLPADALFRYDATGANNNVLVFTDNSSSFLTWIYNEISNSWTFVNDPASFFGGFGFAGENIGSTYYLLDIASSGSIFSAYTLDMDNPGAGWSSRQTTYSDTTSFANVSVVYDEANKVFVIITSTDGITWIYDPVTNQLTNGISSAFPPCNGAGMGCYASFMTYDADLGVIAGKQGDPSSTQIGLYSFDVATETWSASTVELLSNANFNYLPFTANAPKMSDYVNDEGETITMFGGGWTNSGTPGVAASEWFLRTGDPGGINPTTADIDSWLTNFLTGIGMNGAFGRVLVGSLFAMFVFLILTIKGVPWIISLAIGGLGITFLTAATLLSESILLGMVAIILIGGMGLIMALMSGGNRDG